MTTRCVWACGINPQRALGAILTDGYGRFVPEWDTRIWHYWQHLDWDQRTSSELGIQPPEVDAYVLNPAEIRRLGVVLQDDVPCVLFILFDGPNDDATPVWAAIVGESRLETEAADDT